MNYTKVLVICNDLELCPILIKDVNVSCTEYGLPAYDVSVCFQLKECPVVQDNNQICFITHNLTHNSSLHALKDYTI